MPKDSRLVTPKTVNNMHTDLKAFYTWATADGVDLVDTHLLKQIPPPRFESPQIEVLDGNREAYYG